MPEKYPLVEHWWVFIKQFCYIFIVEAVLLMAELAVNRNNALFFEDTAELFMAH